MTVFEILKDWLDRVFGQTEALILVAMITIVIVLLLTLGTYLAPIICGLIMAFALNVIIQYLMQIHIPRSVAILLVMLLFIGAIVALFVVILPLVWTQLQNFVAQIPELLSATQKYVNDLTLEYPDLVPAALPAAMAESIQSQVTEWSAGLVQQIFQQLPNVIGIAIFLLLVPLALFFFLRDKNQLLDYLMKFLPDEKPLLDRVGSETVIQMGRYIRGKLVEIVVVGLVCYIAFLLLGLQYAALLALLVGLSVIIPFVGAAVVTIPVVAVALFQFGWSLEFAWVVIAYTIIQVLDGNVLVPLLFSEANDLHPIVIITSVLAFGGIWGIWGVFFAIPLATFIRTIVDSWPTKIPHEIVEEGT